MAEARRLTQVIKREKCSHLRYIICYQAERCSLFLVDKKNKELVAKVFDGDILPNGEEVENIGDIISDDSEYIQAQAEVRLPISTGIVGHVASTGALLNIRDAYHHPLFFRGCDQETGFKTR